MRTLLDGADDLDPAERKELLHDVAAREVFDATQVDADIAGAVMEAASALDRQHPAEPAYGTTRRGEPEPAAPAAFPASGVKVAARAVTARRGRRDALVPVIEDLQKEARDPADASELFAMLQGWAREKPPRRHCLLGVTESGIQWIDAQDNVQELTRRALGQRLKSMT